MAGRAAVLFAAAAAAAAAGGVGRERALSTKEAKRCAAELDELQALQVRFAVVDTVYSFPIAVYRKTLNVTDFVSDEITRSGMYKGALPARALDDAATLAARLPEDSHACAGGDGCAEKVLVDVGAHVGWWTLLAASKGWKVLSFEPSPPNAALLQLSLCLNPQLAPRVALRPVMLSSSKQGCAVAMPQGDEGSGFAVCSLKGQPEVDWTAEDLVELKDSHDPPISRAFRADTAHLGQALEELWAADETLPHAATLVKLDVGGSELDVLNGALTFLKQARFPVVHLHAAKTTPGGVEALLAPFFKYPPGVGYVVKRGPCLGSHVLPRGRGITLFQRRMLPHEELCAILGSVDT